MSSVFWRTERPPVWNVLIQPEWLWFEHSWAQWANCKRCHCCICVTVSSMGFWLGKKWVSGNLKISMVLSFRVLWLSVENALVFSMMWCSVRWCRTVTWVPITVRLCSDSKRGEEKLLLQTLKSEAFIGLTWLFLQLLLQDECFIERRRTLKCHWFSVVDV